MNKTESKVFGISYDTIKKGWKGLLISFIVGMVAYLISFFSGYGILDPLILALLFGMLIRSYMKFEDKKEYNFQIAPTILIPIGVIFYGARNLNFQKFSSLDITFIFVLLIIFIIYITTIVLLANLFGIKEKIGYLLAIGSSICGASAIAIASPALDAESDEISISLVAVFIAALISLFVILPIVVSKFGIVGKNFALLAGSVLQFTGFVKVAVSSFPDEIVNLALTVKAARYMGLIIIIPLFSSFIKKRFYIPWYLWAFIGAGLVFSYIDALDFLKNYLKIILTILWSIAMASIGLNANLKLLLTKKGLIAIGINLISFLLVVGVFVVSTINFL